MTTNGADEIYPRYSPDGTKIAFSAFTGFDYDIIILDLKDLSQRRLTNSSLGDYRAAWSPDGSRLAYKYFYGNTYIPQITKINFDGTGATQIVGAGGNEDPAWSSTNKVAFYSTRDNSGEIYIMDPAGIIQTRLTANSGTSREPAWSPDGSKIVFSSDRAVSNNYEIWTMNADGSSPVRLTNSVGMDGMPAWGPSPVGNGGQTISIDDSEVIEGDSGQVLAQLKVKLSAPATVPVSVNYATANGTAVAGTEYTAKNGTVFFAVGESEKTIDVSVTGDTVKEGDQTFVVNLSNPLGATLADGQATETIVDNDSFPLVSAASVQVTEGNAGITNQNVTISLSGASTHEISVDYGTVDGTATAGEDYSAIQGKLVFSPGETEKTVTIGINGDIRYEKDEDFRIKLSNPIYAKVAPDQSSAGKFFNPSNGHWYQLVSTPANWDDAKAAAEFLSFNGLTGHLATVTSQSEKDFLVSKYSASQYYLGGFQAPGSVEPGGGWAWITGEPFAYTNWNVGEPNDSGGGVSEDVLYAYANSPYPAGTWNDFPRTTTMAFLVEYDTTPATNLVNIPGTVVITNDDPGPFAPASVSILNPPAQTLSALPKINGTASDNVNGSGIKNVYLHLLRQSDSKYWDGSSWSSATPVPLPAAFSSVYGLSCTWQRGTGLPSPTGPDADHKLTDGDYTLTARAVNFDGLEVSAETTFTINLAGPSVAVTSPADGAILR